MTIRYPHKLTLPEGFYETPDHCADRFKLQARFASVPCICQITVPLSSTCSPPDPLSFILWETPSTRPTAFALAFRVPDASKLSRMDFDQLLITHFGTADLGTLSQDEILAGVEKLRLQFGLEQDSGRRFALWCLLYMLGAAPDLDAFEDEADREAARDFMDMADAEDDE